MIHRLRVLVFYGVLALLVICLGFAPFIPALLWGALLLLPFAVLGIWDLTQKHHSILRNYPLIGHLRFLLEDMGPELHQYFVESDTDGAPFTRDERHMIYRRSKNVVDKTAFGTETDVYAPGYVWFSHSMSPRPKAERASRILRVQVGGPLCTQPYSASVLNISAMSFGALGSAAILALNEGAKRGGFAHNTGEGGLSRYHRQHGGDIIWQIGTGYFGCRTADGDFDPDLFTQQASLDQVKMIEIKISQGAKPGHGGILPGAKVTPEIADARKIAVGVDCYSPTYHSAFSTPLELMAFIAKLRDLSGGKPVGFKLCVGDPSEFLGVCKAMIETEILPDFIVVDGSEGGTGAAPLEFADRVGTPLKEGLVFVQNALTGAGLRDRIRIAASGKLVSGAGMATAMAIGADWINTARGFMFALGCIQAERCQTNACPVGVTTQDSRLQRALVIEDKAERVYQFHRHTVEAHGEVLSAMALDHPSGLKPGLLYQRLGPGDVRTLDRVYHFLEPGQLLESRVPEQMQAWWDAASPRSFRPG